MVESECFSRDLCCIEHERRGEPNLIVLSNLAGVAETAMNDASVHFLLYQFTEKFLKEQMQKNSISNHFYCQPALKPILQLV